MSSVYRTLLPVLGYTITGNFVIRRNGKGNKAETLELFEGSLVDYERKCAKLAREFSRDFFSDISIWFEPNAMVTYHCIYEHLVVPMDVIKLSKFEKWETAN